MIAAETVPSNRRLTLPPGTRLTYITSAEVSEQHKYFYLAVMRYVSGYCGKIER